MKSSFIKRIMALIIVSITLLTVNTVGASAEWKNTNGLWQYNNEDGNPIKNSWLYDKSTGIWCHLNENGIRTIGWFKDTDGKWYYLNADGSMAKNTTIGGYTLGFDGVWIQDNSTTINANTDNSTKISNTNTGIINNGGVNTNTINNYNNYGVINTNNASNNSDINQNDTNVVLPIQIPSTWTKLTNTTYVINGRSAFAYDVRDTSGYSPNKIIIDVNHNLLNKNYDVKIDGGSYNGNEAYVFNYLTNTNSGLEKAFYVVIFKNNKMYGFMMVSKNEDYDKDKQELENVLNTTLVLK